MKHSNLSLKTKLTLMVLILFLSALWVLTYFSTRYIGFKMTEHIKNEQFIVATYIAENIENQVKLRINSLNMIASMITPELLSRTDKLSGFLKSKPLLLPMFQSEMIVLSRQGVLIGSSTTFPEGRNLSFSNIDYFKEVISKKRPAVGRPEITWISKEPVIAFAVPVFDPEGQITAVLAGYTLLSDPAFVGTIRGSIYKDFPDRLALVSPKYRTYISASDHSRIMAITPEKGINPVFDAFMEGADGSGIAVNSRGVEILLSAKHIHTPEWFIRVAMPTKIAFAPIEEMKKRLYASALVLSLIISSLVWLFVKNSLRQLEDANRIIKAITNEQMPMQDIPITRYDEVGILIESLNSHLSKRQKAEKEREQYYKFFQGSDDLMVIADPNGAFKKANPACTRLLGYSEEELVARPFIDFIHPDDKQATLDEMSQQIKRGYSLNFENRYVCKDGSIRLLSWHASYIAEEGITYATARDITARKRLEDELIRTKNEFENFFSILPGLTCIASIDCWFKRLNNKWTETLGYTMEELLSRPLTEFIHPDDIGATSMMVDEHKKGMIIRSFINRYRCKDGSYKWFEWQASTDESKNTIYAVAIDITERINYQKRTLHLSRLYNVLSSINEAIIRAKDINSLCEQVCKIVVEIGLFRMVWIGFLDEPTLEIKPVAKYGYEDGYLDIIKISIDPYSQEGRGPTGTALRDRHYVINNDTENNHIMQPWRDKALKRGYLSSAAFPLFRGDVLYGALTLYSGEVNYFNNDEINMLLSLSENLSFAIESMRLENALRESELRNRLLIENIPQNIFLKDINSVYISCNASYAEELNISPSEIRGKTDYDFYPQDLADKYRADDKMVMETGTKQEFEELYTLGDKDFYIHTTKTPIRDDKGSVVGILGIFHDITDRLLLDRQIKHSLKEKEVLLKEIHHRVKNNMAVVSSMLKLQSDTIKDDKVRQLFEESSQRVHAMARVHEKLYHTEDLSSINFNSYIKTLVEDIINLFSVDTGSVTVEYYMEDIKLDLDSAVPCGLIINELLTNAFKHAFPDNRKGIIKISFRKIMDAYSLSIKDNGTGLPDSFDFTMTDTLGLQIVAVLTKQLDGTLQICSDNGTEVVVTFPSERKQV